MSTRDHGERLAQSRLAILAFLEEGRHGSGAAPGGPQPPDAGAGSSRWQGLHGAGRRYWERHPARLLAGLAGPLLSHWGRRHPLALLALAAGAGALLVLARPWRLVSLTGLLVGALKSRHLASLLMSVLAASRAPPGKRPPR